MSDVKSFTGFIAIDNTTHTTLKLAVEHTREVKVKAALEAFAKAPADVSEMVTPDGADEQAVFVSDLPAFLLKNRAAILAAFNQEVLTRKPRVSKADKKAAAAVAAAASKSAPASVVEELLTA
jgi:hypothetical protein